MPILLLKQQEITLLIISMKQISLSYSIVLLIKVQCAQLHTDIAVIGVFVAYFDTIYWNLVNCYFSWLENFNLVN